MPARYTAKAGPTHNMPPHRLRHFLFTWLKTQGIDDALIQPYSGHASRTSLEIYSRIAITDAAPSPCSPPRRRCRCGWSLPPYRRHPPRCC